LSKTKHKNMFVFSFWKGLMSSGSHYVVSSLWNFLCVFVPRLCVQRPRLKQYTCPQLPAEIFLQCVTNLHASVRLKLLQRVKKLQAFLLQLQKNVTVRPRSYMHWRDWAFLQC
jgi:hypothetical protein